MVGYIWSQLLSLSHRLFAPSSCHTHSCWSHTSQLLCLKEEMQKHNMHGSRGGGSGLGVWTPKWKILRLYVSVGKQVCLLAHLTPWKITKRPIKHSMLGHHRSASETPFKWRFSGGQIKAHFYMYIGFSKEKWYMYESWTPCDRTFNLMGGSRNSVREGRGGGVLTTLF